MKVTIVISSALLLGALHAVSSVSPVIAQAGEATSKNAQPQSTTATLKGNSAAPAGQGKVAGGEAVETKLNTCLSRIPSDSSSGQRLLAEQSCRKEQEIRSASHAAPQF